MARILAASTDPVLLITKGHLVRQTAAQLAAWLAAGSVVESVGRSQYILKAGAHQVGMCVKGRVTKAKPTPGDLAWLLALEDVRVHVVSADIIVGATGREFDFGSYATVVVDEAHAAPSLVKRLFSCMRAQPPILVSASAIAICQRSELQYMAPFLDNACVKVATFRLSDPVQRNIGMPPIHPIVCEVPYGGASLPKYWLDLMYCTLDHYGDPDKFKEQQIVFPSLCCLMRAACWEHARKDAEAEAEVEATRAARRTATPHSRVHFSDYRDLIIQAGRHASLLRLPRCQAALTDDSACLDLCKDKHSRTATGFGAIIDSVAPQSFLRALREAVEPPPRTLLEREPTKKELEDALLKARRRLWFRRKQEEQQSICEVVNDAAAACQVARSSGHLSLLLITSLDPVSVASQLTTKLLREGEIIETRTVHSGQGQQRCKALDKARTACWPDRSMTLATLRKLHRSSHAHGLAAILRKGLLLRTIFSFLKTTVVVIADECSLTLGYNLQGTFDALLCLDTPQSSGELQQRVGRVRRMSAPGRPNWPTQAFVVQRAGTLDALAASQIGLQGEAMES